MKGRKDMEGSKHLLYKPRNHKTSDQYIIFRKFQELL